jgi:hypothetical protein
MIGGLKLKLEAQEKIALLMGIGDYPSSTRWPSTNAYNDLNLIKESLILQGFNTDSVYTLLDSACTREGIQHAFTAWLTPRLHEGMVVYFHFSGLAQQIKDTDGDEQDGYDESIVPFDAPDKNQISAFRPESFVTDDELETLFNQIRRKIGPKGQLLVSMDASTSPAKPKSEISTRGGSDKMSLNDNADLNEFFTAPVSLKVMAPFIQFYSSSFTQLNEEFYSDENDSYGLFTYALCQSLILLNKNASYKEWFEKLRIFMNSISRVQIPIMLGDAEVPVFQGQITGKKEQFEVKKIYSKELVLIDGGKLNQIEKGTEVLFFSDSTEAFNDSNAIAKGVAEVSGLMESEIRIVNNSLSFIPKNAKILVSSFHYKPLAIRLQIDLGGIALEQKLLSHFAFSGFIKRDRLNPELLFVKTKEDILQLKTKQGDVLFQKELKDVKETELPFTLNEKIAEYLRANFLRNLEIDNKVKNPNIECLLTREGNEVVIDGLKNKIKIGSMMKLRITNNSDKGQYFSVIDIQPDHIINVLIPYNKPAEEYYLEPGQTYTTDFELEVLPPYGKDVIKVIMLSNPLDLNPVIKTRGISNILSESTKNPVEILLGNTFIEQPISNGKELKINVSDISSITSMILDISEIQ